MEGIQYHRDLKTINKTKTMNKETQQILDSLITRAKTMEYTIIFNQLKQLEKTLKTETK